MKGVVLPVLAEQGYLLAYLLFSVLSPAKNGAQNKETDGGKHFCCPAKCFSQFSLCEFPRVEGPRYVRVSKFQVEMSDNLLF